MKNRSRSIRGQRGIGLSGAPSLMVIFGVLFLTILTLLIWEQGRSAKNAASLTAEQTVWLYEAQCEADEILAALRYGQIPPSVTEENGVYRYVCPISPTQQLEISVTIGENGAYTVLSRRVVALVTETNEDMPPF